MEDLIKKLTAPFPLSSVGFKPQAVNKEKTSAMAVTYIDARAVAERLDEVFPLAWYPTYEVMQHTEDRLVLMCRIHVKLNGEELVRCDVGESDNDDSDTGREASRWKSAVSDALKRAAVLYGVGRYVYDLPKPWVDFSGNKFSEAGLQKAKAEYMKAVKALGVATPQQPTQRTEARAEPQNNTALNNAKKVDTVAKEVGSQITPKPLEQPSTTLGKQRAEEMHKTLEELGYPRSKHTQIASDVLERFVQDLSELTETQALEVWSYCKRVSRQTARKEAATQTRTEQLEPWQTWKNPGEAKDWAIALKHKSGASVFNHPNHAHNGFEEHKKAYLEHCHKKGEEFDITAVYKAFYEYALDKVNRLVPPIDASEGADESAIFGNTN
jgi:hypothetical protein